jgi:hypothetical protein
MEFWNLKDSNIVLNIRITSDTIKYKYFSNLKR